MVSYLATGRSVLVNEKSFSNVRLFVKAKDCRIRVMESWKGDDYDDERKTAYANSLSAQLSHRDKAPGFEPSTDGRKYMYVALWFDKVYLQIHTKEKGVVIVVTCWAITHLLVVAQQGGGNPLRKRFSVQVKKK